MTGLDQLAPDIKISVNQIFGIDTEMKVDAFSKKNEYVPEIDSTYKFDRDTTLAIISGFAFNKRVLIQGYHGTGKSTHIEQVAARLNWPCLRVNLDSHISRIDLIGKDAIVGVTCLDSLDLAMQAAEQGADYVAFGAFFHTNTKNSIGHPSPNLLKTWNTITTVPCVAIGGIRPENCAALISAGADFLAIISAVWEHPLGPAAAIKEFNKIIDMTNH